MEMSFNLFLDDVRKPFEVLNYKADDVYNEMWYTVKNYDEFINGIRELGVPHTISLDHDLADVHYSNENQTGEINYVKFKEKTGYDACKWLVDYCVEKNVKLPEFHVHSHNPIGAANIRDYLKNAKKS